MTAPTAPVLITGACGYIGSHLVRLLTDAGTPVRVLIRRPDGLVPGLAARADVVIGDLCDRTTRLAAVAGAGTVMHLAACASAWRADAGEFQRVNVDATRALLAEARATGVRRFVHVSTILAMAPFRPAGGRGAAVPLTPYEVTKMAAEHEVERAADSGLDAVIVRPTRVYGPGPCTESNAVTRLVWQYLNGQFRVRLADGGALANYVHAADVAAGIHAAAILGRTGARYMLGGPENVSLMELLALVDDITGAHRRTVAMPSAVGLALGRAAELWGRLGGRPPITAGWVRTFLEDRRADIALAQREIGYAPRPLKVGLEETIAWLAAHHRRVA